MKLCLLAALMTATSPAMAGSFRQSGIFTDTPAFRLACQNKPTGGCPTKFRDSEAPWPQTCTHAGHVYELNMPAAMAPS